jgi:response regulator RpfG family c-di-GMP phosphodiesterase
LLLTDITMPSMDGFQLLRLLRARPELRRMPVMFLTELASESDRLRGYELGVDDYVNKPFTAVELITRVERVLERAMEANAAQKSGMRGDLSKVPLASLLAFIEMERRMGVLQLQHDGETATLYVRDGAVLRIDLAPEHDHLVGIQRFFHLLEWQDGRFELASDQVRIADTLELPTTHVLLEHARVRDEAAR